MLINRNIIFLYLFLVIIWLKTVRPLVCPDVVYGFNCDFQNSTLFFHCTISGDSLFTKLGRTVDPLSRTCKIVLVELCGEDPLGFKIFANVTNHPENTGQSVFDNVGLELAGTTYEMSLHGDLRVNGVPARKPYEEDSYGVFAADVSPDMHIIRVSDDVNDLIRIAYNYKLHRIDVHLKNSLFSNLICGACVN